jgi:hypothetical protein
MTNTIGHQPDPAPSLEDLLAGIAQGEQQL